MEDEYREEEFIPTNTKKSFLTSRLRQASEDSSFLLSDVVTKDSKKLQEESKETEDFPIGAAEDEDWFDAFVNVKINKPRKKRGYAELIGEEQGGKKKKKKDKEGLTDFSKKFSAEERLLGSLLTDQMNLTSSLQAKLDKLMSTKATSAGVSKYTTDFIEVLNQARQLSMNLVEKKTNIKKLIAELEMKEKKEFGKALSNTASDMNAYSASVLRQVMGNRQELMTTAPVPEDFSTSYEEIESIPDIDSIMEQTLGASEQTSDADLFLKYENRHVKIHIVYRGRNDDSMDYDFVAEDEDGAIIEDYPLPIKTKLSINRSTGFATDTYGERYRIYFDEN